MENEINEQAPKRKYISPEEYLEMERASEEKHEYYNGRVYKLNMPDLSPADDYITYSSTHHDIVYNINRLIAPFLHRKGCKLYGSDFRINIPENTSFTYPDFSIVCGEAETSAIYTDRLSNPTVIIEILSQPTKNYKRGTKFWLYRNINTLREYILIDATAIYVNVSRRQPDDSWMLSDYRQLTDTLCITAIGLNLLLSDIYDDVSFEE